jgi:hypothetical protein
MLNTYNNIKVNAVSGTILKNFKESFFLKFKSGDSLSYELLSREPKLLKYSSSSNKYPVVVIQLMIIGENSFIAEVMWKEDFDSMFKDNKND